MHTVKIKVVVSGLVSSVCPTHPDARPGKRGPVTTYAITDVPDEASSETVCRKFSGTCVWLREPYAIPYAALGPGRLVTSRTLQDMGNAPQ